MAEPGLPYTVTAAEAELLEWLRGAQAKRYSIVIFRHADGPEFDVRTKSHDSDDPPQCGTGATFEAAWAARKPFVIPTVGDVAVPFSVIVGGRDSERS